MKLPLLLVFTFILISQIEHSESRQISWLPSVVDSISNKTSQLTNYVRDKGRSIKKFYVTNVQNKITSYLGFDNGDTNFIETPEERETRINKKAEETIKIAENSGTKLIDTITPSEVEFKCTNDDPMIHMSTPQLIAVHGYPAESHTVVTDDGYILTIHRIPHSKNSPNREVPKQTVLLHHGLLGSSADWILAGTEKGLGYILSDFGYDVWFANVRGNTYSRAHVSRDIDSFEFWNFTFHDVSQHDLPTVIDYIRAVKGEDVKINYIGHSMGTTVLFALLSTKPEYNNKLRAGFALAPVAYMTDIKSPIKLLAKYSDNIEYLMKLLGANEFLPQNTVLRWLSKHACEINHIEEAICENSMFVLCGHDERQFNRSLLPIILGHVPAGASTRTLVHYAQEIKQAGRFQQFDYGPVDNMKAYGTVTPPEYPLRNITLPIALFSSENDWLAGDIDVANLYAQLANPIAHYIVPMKEFNHIDFLWAVDAKSLVYDKLLKLLLSNEVTGEQKQLGHKPVANDILNNSIDD